MVGSYRDDGARGRCVKGVRMTGGGYISDREPGRGPRILPEYAQLGTTLSGVEWLDCSARATSSAQEGILVVCDVCVTACWVDPNVCGGCGSCSSCDELGGPTGAEGELVSLSMYRWGTDEEVAGEGGGFTNA